MGLLTNLFLAQTVAMRNSSRIKRRSLLADTLTAQEAERSMLIFGGREGAAGPAAERIRLDTIDEYVEDASRNHIPTIILVYEQDLQKLSFTCTADNPVLTAGRDFAWQLFDARTRPQEVEQMFEMILWTYCGAVDQRYEILGSWIRFLLGLLQDCFEPRYYTFQNMDHMAGHLFRTDLRSEDRDSRYDARSFLDWIESSASRPVPASFRRELSSLWKSLAVFETFWRILKNEMRQLSDGTASGPSFNDHLRNGNVCLCPVPDSGRDLAAAVLLAQLYVVGVKSSIGVRLVDYYVRLPKLRGDKLLPDRSSYCVVGQSPAMLQINSKLAGASYTVACLGMQNAADAQELVKMMAGTSMITKAHWSFGRASFLSLDRVREPDLTEDQLHIRNCPDGQAVVCDGNGYRIIRHVLT